MKIYSYLYVFSFLLAYTRILLWYIYTRIF